MAEETTFVPPVSPLTKSKGGDKRRSFVGPRSSTSSGKGVPHYLRASTGSCHEFCKHGKKEEHDSEVKDSRPWRKPVTGNARDMQQTRESGVTAGGKKTVVVKAKPSAEIKSPGRDTTKEQEISTASENVDVFTEQGSSDTRQIVIGESKSSDGPETASSSEEMVKQENSAASENVRMTNEGASSDAKDLSKKSFTVSEVKPSLRPPSPISSGPSVGRIVGGRKSVDGRKSLDVEKAFEGRKGVDGRKSVEGRKSVDGGRSFAGRKSIEVPNIVGGRKSVDGGSSFEGRKSIDVRKSIEGRTTLNGRKRPDESKVDPETTQNCELSSSSAENNSDDIKSADEMKSIEGSESSVEKKGSEESKSLNLETKEKDDSLGNAKNKGKSELLKKHVAAPKPKTSTTKPPSPLHPLAAKTASLKPSAVKPPSPSPSPLYPSAAKSHSLKSLAVKPPSPLHPSSDTPSRTGGGSLGCDKFSNSELDAKKVGTDTTVSPSYKPSLNEEEITTKTKKVRVVRVVSSVRKQSRITKVAAKDTNDQGVEEDTADASKIAPEKESVGSTKLKVTSSNSSLPLAQSVSKTTIRTRILHTPSRPKKSPVESEPKVAAKDASTSGLRKGKAVDLDSENLGPTTLKARRTTSLAETAQINRRSSLKKRVSAVEAVKKNSSDSILLRRPSLGRKKNVQVLFNKVIEETASRLARTRKSKVLALVGAFETVISIQKNSSTGTKPKPRKISSLAKASY